MKQPPAVKRLFGLYFHHFPFVMLTTTEAVFLHTSILIFAMFIAYGIYSYLPATIMFSISRASYYLFGESNTLGANTLQY
ncbi:uncharacterized protein SPAPADRAFT_60075 [Spathaspora passalidarum NRRL Y-27907]|uniref:Uncharacterized protein n=1 Tax=Spathaspora passalidarum (strain NRRL Y-27907 / 11-Y1) TaxID=619300 RepID=G3ALV9_SPAPN|nr:uncharacterized protein SPAPADRAFT_60075 [Spathaspora passalidarum NRRL Y-27907]EGW32718.1 hypothetical protein SPAPADRAFT_60075 [Spathaspora passalidarum NRRL Y-27907]